MTLRVPASGFASRRSICRRHPRSLRWRPRGPAPRCLDGDDRFRLRIAGGVAEPKLTREPCAADAQYAATEVWGWAGATPSASVSPERLATRAKTFKDQGAVTVMRRCACAHERPVVSASQADCRASGVRALN